MPLLTAAEEVKLAQRMAEGTKKPKQTHKRQFKAGCQHSQRYVGRECSFGPYPRGEFGADESRGKV